MSMFSLKTSFRYAFSRNRGQRTTSIMILIGIAVGLVALLVISSVMNGLQTAQIDQLRNLESFDLIVSSQKLTKESISALDGVETAFNFLETNILVVDKTSGESTSARMRAYTDDVLSGRRMAESFAMARTANSPDNGFIMSYSMMRSLYLVASDDIRITFLKPGNTATIVPYATAMPVSGFYSSRMSEFSNSTLFMDYDQLAAIIGEDGARIGIYVSGNQGKVIKLIRSLDPEAEILTWQEYNRAIYSALNSDRRFATRAWLCFISRAWLTGRKSL